MCLLFSNISDTFFYQKFPALSVQFINGGGGDNIYFHTDIATTTLNQSTGRYSKKKNR